MKVFIIKSHPHSISLPIPSIHQPISFPEATSGTSFLFIFLEILYAYRSISIYIYVYTYALHFQMYLGNPDVGHTLVGRAICSKFSQSWRMLTSCVSRLPATSALPTNTSSGSLKRRSGLTQFLSGTSAQPLSGASLSRKLSRPAGLLQRSGP